MSDTDSFGLPKAAPASKSRGMGTWWLYTSIGGCLLAAGWLALQWWQPNAEELLASARLSQDSDPESAIRLLEQSIRVSAEPLPAASELLCVLRARQGDWPAAEQLLAGMDSGNCSSEFLMEFGRLAAAAGRKESAEAALNEVAARTGLLKTTALRQLCRLYQQQHDDLKLLNCLKALALIKPEDPSGWWAVLSFLDSRQLSTDAIRHIQESLRQPLPAPDLLEMRHQLIARLVEQGQIQEACTEIENLPESEQAQARTDRHRAALLRLEGRPQEAMAALERSRSMEIAQPGVAWLRGLIRFDLQQYEASVRDFELVLKADPQDLIVHLKLADALRACGQIESADKHQETAAAIRTTRQRINLLKEQVRRQPDQAAFQELAELHRRLHDEQGATWWSNKAAGH